MRISKVGQPRLLSFFLIGFVWSNAAWAEPIRTSLGYSTTLTIGSEGLTGPSVVNFQGVEGSTVTTPISTQPGQFSALTSPENGSNLTLGSFALSLPTGWTSSTYKDTPILLTFKVNSVDGDSAVNTPPPLEIQGILNGTISASQPSTLQANFITASTGTPFFPDNQVGGFTIGSMTHVLTLPQFSIALDPSFTDTDKMTVTGVLISSSTVPVPEPASIVLFTTLIAGLMWRTRSRSKA